VLTGLGEDENTEFQHQPIDIGSVGGHDHAGNGALALSVWFSVI
jgi:hypothetical protein